MSYIKRNLENVVRQVTREYPVLLVTGPRQVGKTTMLQKLMEGTERGYVTLDDLNERNIAKTDPELFLQLHKPPVLIDEVQYAPELFTYIKIYVDKNHEPGAFWLTGSQVFKLMQGVQESLAGRVAVLSLTSLSQAEISGGTMKPFTVDLEDLSERQKEREQADTREIFERIYQGSMPAIVSGINSNSQLFYSSYLSTYATADYKDGFFNEKRPRNRCATVVWNAVSKSWSELSAEEKDKAGKTRAESHNKIIKHTASFNENLSVFQDFVYFCNDRGINLLLTAMPASSQYLKYLTPEYKNIFYSVLDKVDGTVHLLDLVEDSSFDNNFDFNDTDHLSDSGARKLSQMISSILNQINN